MKKILLSAAVIAATVLSLSGCKNHQTPETDTTKLWPAYDSNAKKYGYIDNTGTFKIPAMYDAASNFPSNYFSCGYAVVTIDQTQHFIDKKGSMKYSAQKNEYLNPFFYSYARINNNGKYGLMDKSFKFTISPFYVALGNMSSNGLIAAKQNNDGNYGYVDAKGKSKISPMFKSAEDFIDGYAVASMDGSKYGIIDKSGKFAIQPTYTTIKALGNGRWSVKTEGNNKYSLIDIKGNVKQLFDEINSSADNEPIFTIKNDEGKWGVADKDGNILLSYRYDGLGDFCEGIAAATTNGDNNEKTLYLIDKKGTVLYSEANASAVTPMHNGLIQVSTYDNKSGKTTYKWINKNGQMIYSWTKESTYGPNLAPKAKNNEWTPEPFFILD